MKKFKKILVSAICASMVIQSVPAQAQEAAVKIVETAAEELKESGCTDVSKLSVEELRTLYGQMSVQPTELYEEVPVTTDPYTVGKMSGQALDRVKDYINYFRTNAGLNKIELTNELNEKAQYGALVIAMHNKLDHRPQKPEIMSAEDFAIAYDATSHSNLAFSFGYPTQLVLDVAVKGQLDDKDKNNISRVGHRRWLLKPSTKTMGVGNACNMEFRSHFTDIYVFGKDVATAQADYDFIAWPASGNNISDLFAVNVPWSVSLNPNLYKEPDPAKVTVRLTQLSDGKVWNFDQSDNETISEDTDYFNVETSGYGEGDCIIFRPDSTELEKFSGDYEVQIMGLQDKNGSQVQLVYRVTFAPMKEAAQAATVELSETKKELTIGEAFQLTATVKPSDAADKKVIWSTSDEAVASVDASGMVHGKSAGTAVITASTSNGMSASCTVTVKEKMPEESKEPFLDVKEGDYFYDAVKWAVSRGITSGYGTTGKFMPNNVCTRAQVVTFLWKQAGSPKSSGNFGKSFKDVNEDDYFYDAVMWAAENGITEGVGNTEKFMPHQSCTRANVVTFLWRAAKKTEVSENVNDRFPDVHESDYFYQAMRWAVKNKITEGYGTTGKFMPYLECTRANIVTFMYRAEGQPPVI